jgi:NTE family protein
MIDAISKTAVRTVPALVAWLCVCNSVVAQELRGQNSQSNRDVTSGIKITPVTRIGTPAPRSGTSQMLSPSVSQMMRPSMPQPISPSASQAMPSSTPRTMPPGMSQAMPASTPLTMPPGTSQAVPSSTPLTMPSSMSQTIPLSIPVTVQQSISVPVVVGQRVLPPIRRPRVALALGGGGVRGAAHVGVLRAFAQAGIPVDIIAGTSMGAIVGGLYSAGIDIGVIERKFDDGSLMRSFMDVPLRVSIATAPVRAVPRTLSHKNYDGLYTGTKFRKYLDQTVPAYDQYVEHFKIPFAAVALDLTDGKPYALMRGKLGAVLQASSAVPELREPVQIGSQLFVDGGVVDNIPVTVARDMGGDIVIAVNVDETLVKAPLSDFKPMGSVARRMMVMQLASADAMQLQLADVVIRPHVDGIGMITTRTRDARYAIRAGERAAWEAIPLIKAKLAQASVALAGTTKVVDNLGK